MQHAHIHQKHVARLTVQLDDFKINVAHWAGFAQEAPTVLVILRHQLTKVRQPSKAVGMFHRGTDPRLFVKNSVRARHDDGAAANSNRSWLSRSACSIRDFSSSSDVLCNCKSLAYPTTAPTRTSAKLPTTTPQTAQAPRSSPANYVTSSAFSGKVRTPLSGALLVWITAPAAGLLGRELLV